MARSEQRAPLLSPSRAWLALLGLGVDEEHDYAPAVEGTLPSGLKGTLFRNGPGLFERNGYKKSTLLDGRRHDSALSVNDGAVRFRNRFVQTSKFKEESTAQRFLHPTWTTPAPKYLRESASDSLAESGGGGAGGQTRGVVGLR